MWKNFGCRLLNARCCTILELSRQCTIFALSSGALPSAIAIVRISGAESLNCLQKLTKRKRILSRYLFYANIRGINGDLIDHGMAVFLPGPSTSTGEDTVELYVHGSRAVVDCISETLKHFDHVRPAKAGEFTKRAFLNGKLTLSDVESLSHLLHAQTQRQRRLALRHNALDDELSNIREQLIELYASLNAAIDFGDDVDYDQTFVITKLRSVQLQLESISKRMKRGTLITNGISVVILGRTNAGKSSLINRIADRDVAIVSDIDGTTRDALEIHIQLAATPVTIVDTAGIRTAGDSLEAQGISRTLARAQKSDLILVVIDVTMCSDIESEVNALLTECQLRNDEATIIVVCNKCDLLPSIPRRNSLHWPVVYTSCLSGQGLEVLLNVISEQIDRLCPIDDDRAFLSADRHREAVDHAIVCLEQFESAKDTVLAAECIRDACDSIGELAGAVVNEEILDKIFSSFCIGK